MFQYIKKQTQLISTLFKGPGPILPKILTHQETECLSHIVPRLRAVKAEELRFDFQQ